MGKVLLALTAVVAVELILIVCIGKAIGYRDKISRTKRRTSFALGDLPAVGALRATRR